MPIHARFSLSEVTRIQMYGRASGAQEWKQVQGVRVKLAPVQGEPFGSATPGGQLEMVIANPEAAAVFNEAEIGQQFDMLITAVESLESTVKA